MFLNKIVSLILAVTRFPVCQLQNADVCLDLNVLLWILKETVETEVQNH